MPLLSVQGLQLSFVLRLIMEGVTFEVDYKDRIGLVGVNGSGKTTLFKLLCGTLASDSGNIYRSKELKLGTMEQSILNDDETLFNFVLSVFSRVIKLEGEIAEINAKLEAALPEAIPDDSLISSQTALREEYEAKGGLTYRSRTRSALMGLGFLEAELDRPLSSFSGGQRNKAQLARLLLSDANLLLLDEPTNHLDITATEWLEDFLLSYGGAFIVISHDRYFLDKVTNKTMELKHTHLTVTNGNYTRHVELRSTQNENTIRHYQNTQKEIRRISAIVEQQRRFGQEHNFVTAASKLKQIERLKATLVEPEKELKSIHFSFRAEGECGNDVLVAKELSKHFSDEPLFSSVELTIKKGEKVFLLGENGCGKTTLLKIFMRKLHPDSGTFYLGSNVRPGYYDQNVNNLHMSNTILEEIHDYYPTKNLGELRNALASFLFVGDDVYKPVDATSGGERARIQLLKLMLSGANFLLLDEPTNHLDIASREALESALINYGGTMLIVTHDRYLVNRLADRVLYMADDGITECIGGYDEFLAARSQKKIERQRERKDKVNTYKLQKDMSGALNRAMGELKRAEERIIELERELSEIDEQLSIPQFDYKKTLELAQKAEHIKRETDVMYEKLDSCDVRVRELEAQIEDSQT